MLDQRLHVILLYWYSNILLINLKMSTQVWSCHQQLPILVLCLNLPLASIITVWLINSVEFTAEYATQVTLLLVQSGRFQTSSMSVKILRFCLTVLLSYLYLASAAGDDSRRFPLKYLKFQCRHSQKLEALLI